MLTTDRRSASLGTSSGWRYCGRWYFLLCVATQCCMCQGSADITFHLHCLLIKIKLTKIWCKYCHKYKTAICRLQSWQEGDWKKSLETETECHSSLAGLSYKSASCWPNGVKSFLIERRSLGNETPISAHNLATLDLHADKSISRRLIFEAQWEITPEPLLQTWINFISGTDK